MSGESLALMLVSMAVLWGGLAASIVYLARHPENTHTPDGGEDTQVPD